MDGSSSSPPPLDSFAIRELARGKPPRAQNHPKGCFLLESSAPSEVEELLYNLIMYFLYMAKNSTDKLYIGITKNPQNRIKYHNQKRGAKFTKYIPDFEIVFLEKYSTLAEARKREIQIKKWSRGKKELLINRYQQGLKTKI